MRELVKFLIPFKKELILGPFFKLLEAVFELLLPTLMVLMINNGVNKNDSNYVMKIGAIMLTMAILGFGSSLICQFYAARASQGFGTTLRNALFKHISKLSPAELNSFGTSTLINRMTNDINQLQLAVAMLIRLVIRAPFIAIGAIVLSMFLDFRLALILLAVTPVFGLILYLIIGKTSPLYTRYQQKVDRLGLTLNENLSGVRIIRAFAKTESEQGRFNIANNDLTATAVHVGRLSALLNPMTTFVMNAAIVVILWVGAIHINTGLLTQGEIIAFVNYLTQILLALIVVSNLVIIFTKAYASAKRVSEILNTVPSVKDGRSDLITQRDVGVPLLEFKHVSFGYNATGDRALSDISFSVQPGETVGIIGGTGSGKSTLVNLISRFYETDEGDILLNGVSIKKLTFKALRDQIGMVPQKALLFTGTIAENIRWGNLNASDEEVIAAAKIAQANEFIVGLSDGYSSRVERNGANYSGGQRQRLTIARALVKQPNILILDDSSSALDYATEASLRQAIRASSQVMTLIIVSQRVSSIRQSDKILVLEEGHLVGLGTHEQLMKTCQLYQEIYASQVSTQVVQA